MKALVLGCGEMGRVAIGDLVTHGVFTEVVVASRRLARAEGFLTELPSSKTRTAAVEVDVRDTNALTRLMKGCDVVCNMAGPNYLNAVPVAQAAIAAGVSMVDVSDDWAATLEILDLHDEAKKAGVTVIVGLGASPGVTNVLARKGADILDRTDEVHTAWIMRGSDLGGPALCAHLLYSLPDRAFVFQHGKMHEVRPFVDGKEVLEFAGLGDVEVMHIGHPEPFTLSRFIEGVTYADDKATFLPAKVNEMIVTLGQIAHSGLSVCVDGRSIEPIDFAANYLYETSKRRMADVSTVGSLRTEVRGELDGKRTRIIYSAAGRIGIGTGVPAAIGAQLLAIGKINKPGVYPPEACVEPDWFLAAVAARRIGDVEERIIQE
ncbi:MAG: saccharopine dehydrogenase NADP-binding domain-containing protein [Gemmatimonadales bacterium]